MMSPGTRGGLYAASSDASAVWRLADLAGGRVFAGRMGDLAVYVSTGVSGADLPHHAIVRYGSLMRSINRRKRP